MPIATVYSYIPAFFLKKILAESPIITHTELSSGLQFLLENTIDVKEANEVKGKKKKAMF